LGFPPGRALYLSSGDGQAVKITPADVATVDNGADGVLFAAGRTLAPWTLTEPRDPLEACALSRTVRTGAAHARELLRLWLYSLPSNPRSKPPLALARKETDRKHFTVFTFADPVLPRLKDDGLADAA